MKNFAGVFFLGMASFLHIKITIIYFTIPASIIASRLDAENVVSGSEQVPHLHGVVANQMRLDATGIFSANLILHLL